VDTGSSFYYDGTSGALVAIVNVSNAGTTCVFGPSGGFVQPACDGAAVSSPPLQCIVDAGPFDASPG
jgi:hypothetical protein